MNKIDVATWGTARSRWVALILTIAALLAVGTLLPGRHADAAPPADTLIDHPATTHDMPASFADVIAAVKPAVVNISASKRLETGPLGNTPGLGPNVPGSPFDELFRRFFDDNGEGARQLPPGAVPRNAPLRQASGSGFIIDPDGWVVTNNHVVDGAEEVTITLDDGRRFDAHLEGTDPRTDLALLRIETDETLPYVRFGESDATRVGDWVLAIGNPFGLGGTATVGIVSARGRDIQSGPYDDYLQIDAPINMGNSGGPLFDLSGRVIGVNTAIFSPNGGSVGIGFAIPSSQATPVIAQLRDAGYVERGWLGVQIQSIDSDLAEGLGLDSEKGALVAEVVPESPAERAGVRTGDVIMALDGKTLEDVKDLTRGVGDARPDQNVELEVWRNGKRKSIDVTIGRLDDGETVATARHPKNIEPDTRALGLSLTELTPELRQRQGIEDGVDGLLVVAVEPGSPASQRDIRPGDVVLMVGQQPTKDLDTLEKEVESATRDGRSKVVLQVARGANRGFVAVPVA